MESIARQARLGGKEKEKKISSNLTTEWNWKIEAKNK